MSWGAHPIFSTGILAFERNDLRGRRGAVEFDRLKNGQRCTTARDVDCAAG